MFATIISMFRILGIAFLSSIITILLVGGMVYAATGTKLLPNFLSSGVDFMSFLTDGGNGTAGIDARSYYTRVNGSWLGYPGDNRNYLRNDTFINGTLYDEDNTSYSVNPNGTSRFNTLSGNTVCLGGDCKTAWPGGASTSGGIVTGPLRWSSEYGAMKYNDAWTTCLGLVPADSWRLPTADEVDYGRRVNGTLFTGNKNYWSSSPSPDKDSNQLFLALYSAVNKWNYCTGSYSLKCYSGGGDNDNNYPMVFRCVSNS